MPPRRSRERLSPSSPVTGGAAPPLVVAPPHPGCEATVVIPACDEAERIAATLAALAGQVDPAGRPLDRRRFEIILLANNCRDATAGIARRFGQGHPTLALHVVELLLPHALANAGNARRILMDEGCRRLLAAGRPEGVIASLEDVAKIEKAPSMEGRSMTAVLTPK